MNDVFSKIFKFFKKKENKVNEEIERLDYVDKKQYDEIYSIYQENKIRFEMIDKILSAKKIINKNFQEYEKIYTNEFLVFANKENSLAEEAEVILKFQKLRNELIKIINFNFLYTKNIVAVGGGFSTGKSAFLNELLSGTSLNLPVGINPVTAIPTYIINSSNEQVIAFSANGGRTEFDFKSYEKISHDYMKGFSFNLKEILPYIVIQTKIPNDNYGNICFIDTPGYNPGDKKNDREASLENIVTANSVIWLLSVSEGTIPNSDIKFLTEIENKNKNKKLYLVLSKADLKSKKEQEEIVENIEGILDEEGIEYEGISVYSANKKEEYFFRKKSLFEFLKEEDKKISVESNIKKEIKEIMDRYVFALTNEIEKFKKIIKKINNVQLNLIKLPLEDTEQIDTELSMLKKEFKIEELEQAIVDANSIRQKFNAIISKLFLELSK